MSLTSRRHQQEQSESPCEEDRFSSLPSSLIGYILSFLPTKDAVATSVLSTTWRDFWTLITCLDFDDDLLLRSQNKKCNELLKAEFVDFVSRVLLVGRFPWIEAFRLRCYHRYNLHNVSEWLESVLKSNVQELDVDVLFRYTDYLVLPRTLFTCRTLVKLKLNSHIYMNVPASIYFPCLKLIKLAWVEFSDAESITRFLSGCPMLDILYLVRCIGKNIKDVKISVPTLTSLSLVFLHIKEEDFDKGMVDGAFPTLRIVLDTPFLRKIYIQEYEPHCYVFENEIPHLSSAAINFPGHLIWCLKRMVPFKDVHHAAVKDLLKGVSKVRKLYFFALATHSRLDLPSFENLTDLEFGTCQMIKLPVLVKLLETAPVLSSLKIVFNRHGTGDDDEEDDILELDASRSSVPKCFLLHLKTVKIEDFQGSNKEVKLVEYLLSYAEVLEKLTATAISDVVGKSPKACELLLTLPRASRACQIEIL